MPRPEISLGILSSDMARSGDGYGRFSSTVLPYNVADFGAKGDGVTDDYTSFVNADKAAIAAGYPLFIPPGTFKLGTSLTISSPLQFAAGGVLQPANTKTVTVNGAVYAEPMTQVFDASLGGTVTFGQGKIWLVRASWFGFTPSATGAANTSAAQAAFNAAQTYRQCVIFPAGIFAVTGAIDNKNCPFQGGGDEVTSFYPTTSVHVFDVSLVHGVIGGFSINYTNVTAAGITNAAIGMQLKQFNQAALSNVTVWRGYNAFKVTAGTGDGYIWQASFDHVVSSYCKDYAFNISSSSDSTTVKFSNCHVYAVAGGDVWSGWTNMKGWKADNVTSIEFSNCSMDGGDTATPAGTVLNLTNMRTIKIVGMFHHEGYTQTIGGTTATPMILGALVVNIDSLFLVSWTVDVGAGNTAYYLRTSSTPSYLVLGDIVELGPVTTSGSRGYGVLSGFTGVHVLAQRLVRTQFFEGGVNTKNIFEAERFNDPTIRQIDSGAYVACNNVGATEILTIARQDATLARYNTAFVFVHGENGSTGAGFADIVTIVSATNGATTVNTVSSTDNGGVPPIRTYTVTTDASGVHLKLQLAASSSSVIAYTPSSMGWNYAG